MESAESSKSKDIIVVSSVVAVVFFAFVVAIWFAFKQADTQILTNPDGYIETEEKTKEEIVTEIEQRNEIILDEGQAEEKRDILESIKRRND